MDNQRDVLREEEVESRWEAAPAVVVVIALQLTLALVSRELDWKLWYMPWWVWILAVGPELVLLVALVLDSVLQALERLGHRRNVALILLAIISVENAVALVALRGSLISGQEHSGGQLLLKGMTIWGTNVIAYGLWFWGVDRGVRVPGTRFALDYAAILCSWMSPPSRSRRRTWSTTTTVSDPGGGFSIGGRWWRERWGRCSL